MRPATITDTQSCWGGDGCAALPVLAIHQRGRTCLWGSTSQATPISRRCPLEHGDSIEPVGTATTKCIGSVYRARYYDPIRSRFAQEDPLGLAGGGAESNVYTDNVGKLQTNLYQYASDNPINSFDP